MSRFFKMKDVSLSHDLFSAGLEAKRVFEDAQRLLKVLIGNGSLKGRGLVGFWHAQSSGDDIHVYQDDVSSLRDAEPIATFRCLRQQVRLRRRSLEGFPRHACLTFPPPPAAGEGQLRSGTVPESVGLRGSRGQRRAGLRGSVCCGRIWSRGAESAVPGSGRRLSQHHGEGPRRPAGRGTAPILRRSVTRPSATN